MAKMRKIFTFLVGLLIPGYLIYNRLRFRNSLIDLNVFAFIYIFFFALNLGLFCLFLTKALIPWILKWLTRAGDKNTGQWLTKPWVETVLKILGYPKMAMKEVYGYIFEKLPPKLTVFALSKKLHKYPEEKLNVGIIYCCVLFEILPRMIILGYFVYEIFWVGKLHYFYMSLSLLIIPFLFNFVVFLVEDIGPRLHKIFDTIVTVEEHTLEDGRQLVGAKYKVDIENQIHVMEYMMHYYYPMSHLLGHITSSLELRQKVKTYVLLIYHLILSIGWGYVLFFITKIA
jgi:hypothetical protein